MNGTRQVICITPVKNEEWILDTFLNCASQWADHIIIADQGSTDRSLEIAQAHPKVRIIHNDSGNYDEGFRQRLLLAEARKIEGQRVILSLDADEIISGNYVDCCEWKSALAAPVGTVFGLRWANLAPGLSRYWPAAFHQIVGFVDDGREHTGEIIHSVRVPLQPGQVLQKLNRVSLLHFQYADWNRMRSKHRWYQCWEKLNLPGRSSLDIYRRYHHMYAIPKELMTAVLPEWFASYEREGLDVTSIREPQDGRYWWDREVAEWLARHGPKRFRRLAIWDFDWRAASVVQSATGSKTLNDPRNILDRILLRYLRKTQPAADRPAIRFLDGLLRKLI